MTICPNCTFRNTEDANFCQSCGHPLYSCPNCGTINAPNARFCQNCGQELQAVAMKPVTATIAGIVEPVHLEQYIPPTLLEKLASARARGTMVGERRIVTILFCDVVSSTSLAEQLDPEEWTEIMNSAFPYLIAPVYRYEGTVASLLGDGLLAFFGAPIAHEDDAQRAVLTGLEILNGLPELNSKIHSLYDLDFNVRIGINTGLVVVGEVGSDMRLEYTAMGDAVNLAARMQQAAEPGSILITQYTYRVVAPYFECEPLGPIEVKGKREPVDVYRVLQQRSEVARARGIPGLHAPLVAREREMDVLRQTIADLKVGRGSIVCLIAEAGLGKTRLVEEVRTLVKGQPASETDKKPILCSESRGLSYESMSPYAQFQQQIRSVCSIRPDDSPDVIRQQVRSILDRLRLNEGGPGDAERRLAWQRMEQILNLLLGVQEEAAEERGTLEGTDLKNALFDVMLDFWRSFARQQPVLMIFDDLHWADASSVELLEHLLQLTDECPVFFLCAFRMHRQAPVWRIRQVADTYFPHRYTELTLRSLSTDESALLVDHLLHSAELPPAVKQLILDKSEGNPFFVEEVVRELIERKVLVRKEQDGQAVWHIVEQVDNIPVPDTLQALLTARIDRLEEGPRRTLQLAAVVGRNFTERVLKLVSDVPGGIDMHLVDLQRASLIMETSRLPEPQYNFRHSLIQEAAYGSILLRQRRAFHRRVGETLEQLYGDDGEELAPMLAHHFYQAGDLHRAADYFCFAGDHAARLYANAEAVGHYTQAIDIENRLQMPDEIHLIDLYRKRGQANELQGRFEEARADYLAQLELARKVGNEQAHWQALLNLGFLWASRDYEETGVYFHQALDLARRLEEPAIVAHSLNRVGNWHLNKDEPHIAEQYHQEALTILEELDDKVGVAETFDLLALAIGIRGNLVLSETYFEKAIALFRELNDPRGLSSSLATLANLYGAYELYDFYPISRQFEKVLPQAEEALQIAQEIGWRSGEAYALLALARCLHTFDEYNRALQAAEEGLALAEQIMHHQWMGGGHYTIAAILFTARDFPGARQHLETALAIAEATHSRLWLALDSGALASILVRQGDLDEAERVLGKIYQVGQLPETTGQQAVWQAAAELALARGEPERALDIFKQVQSAILQYNDNVNGPKPSFGLRTLLARIYRALGQFDAAKVELETAIRSTEQYFQPAKLWRVHAELGWLWKVMGNEENAEAEFTLARQLAIALSEKMPDTLKEHFISAATAFINSDSLPSAAVT